ncbi:MAG: PilZ domain-containing protein [Bdellovibrionota bacterium]
MSERPKIARKFGRSSVDCEAVLVFPSRNARPRIRAQLIQIGKGGCALSTTEKLYIGEDCLVWAVGGGQKYLGTAGRIVWAQPFYAGQQTLVVGVEFKESIELSNDLLTRLRAKQQS